MQQFDDYQKFTEVTVSYPEDSAIGYTAMGLIGETGEYAEKIMQLTNQVSNVQSDEEEAFEELKQILNQAIDALWYCTRAACALKLKLSDVIDNNVSKLISRLKRGVIQGEGDNR